MIFEDLRPKARDYRQFYEINYSSAYLEICCETHRLSSASKIGDMSD
jgi:hypothetical protein